MQPKIGIILINYKDYAKRFLEDCRDSMRLLDYPREKFVVYIVDNATSPETQQYLHDTWPEAVVIPNEKNSGWGGGNNIGIARAFVDECQDVVLSNMDVIVEKEWLKELVKGAYSDVAPSPQPSPVGRGGLEKSPLLLGEGQGEGKSIGIVQSKLLLHPVGPDGVQRINSLGNQIHFLGFGYCQGYGEAVIPLRHSEEQGDEESQQTEILRFAQNDAPSWNMLHSFFFQSRSHLFRTRILSSIYNRCHHRCVTKDDQRARRGDVHQSHPKAA